MDKNFKNLLQEWFQKFHIDLPTYETQTQNNGFISRITLLNGHVFEAFSAHCKKDADKSCAEKAYSYVINNAEEFLLRDETIRILSSDSLFHGTTFNRIWIVVDLETTLDERQFAILYILKKYGCTVSCKVGGITSIPNWYRAAKYFDCPMQGLLHESNEIQISIDITHQMFCFDEFDVVYLLSSGKFGKETAKYINNKLHSEDYIGIVYNFQDAESIVDDLITNIE